MTLPDVLDQLERRAAEAEVVGATAPLASVYRAVVAELRPLTGGNGKGGPEVAPPREDRLLTVEEAASLLGVAPRWLYRHARTLPFARHLSPKALRFSEAGLRRWVDTRR